MATKKPYKQTIVVPTFKEAGNLKALVERVYAALKDHQLDTSTQLIVVDDNSQDGTERIINELAATYPVRIIVRTTETGLSSAVLRGFAEADPNSDVLMCMDADLQHPPERVPFLLAALRKDNIEFVIGTRYGEGTGVDKNWPLYRQVISSTARLMARPLTPLSDPMTGFFGIRKSALSRAGKKVNPIGFKIALELFVKANIKKHAEVPIVFGVRTEGESKLSKKVIVNYILHLIELYNYSMPWFLPLLVLVGIAILYYAFQIIF